MGISRVWARGLGGPTANQDRRKTSRASGFPATRHSSAVMQLLSWQTPSPTVERSGTNGGDSSWGARSPTSVPLAPGSGPQALASAHRNCLEFGHFQNPVFSGRQRRGGKWQNILGGFNSYSSSTAASRVAQASGFTSSSLSFVICEMGILALLFQESPASSGRRWLRKYLARCLEPSRFLEVIVEVSRVYPGK